VDDLSLWEFAMAVDGWRRANSPEEPASPSLSEAEHDALMAKYS